jgi:predicted nicotinamide N-methyase
VGIRDQKASGEELLSGIPVEKLKKRQEQSKQTLRAMREIEKPKQGAPVWWLLLWAGVITVFIVLLIRISF